MYGGGYLCQKNIISIQWHDRNRHGRCYLVQLLPDVTERVVGSPTDPPSAPPPHPTIGPNNPNVPVQPLQRPTLTVSPTPPGSALVITPRPLSMQGAVVCLSANERETQQPPPVSLIPTVPEDNRDALIVFLKEVFNITILLPHNVYV